MIIVNNTDPTCWGVMIMMVTITMMMIRVVIMGHDLPPPFSSSSLLTPPSFPPLAVVSDVPQTPSFLHLHVGIDATGMTQPLQCHYAVVDDWNLGE